MRKNEIIEYVSTTLFSTRDETMISDPYYNCICRSNQFAVWVSIYQNLSKRQQPLDADLGDISDLYEE